MTRLIGSRWKCREALSRGVLIRPVSCAEPWKTQSSFSIDITFMPFVARRKDERSRVTYSSQTHRFRVLGSGALSEGSHPFSFRTRQLSPLEPMVLTFTGGKSR